MPEGQDWKRDALWQPLGLLPAGIKIKEEVRIMKGYTVESGYMGYVNGEYMLFASETDYVDYVEN